MTGSGAHRVLGGLLLAAIEIWPSQARAQNGRTTGVVKDIESGIVLEAARLILTGTSQVETSDQSGRYVFRSVADGTEARLIEAEAQYQAGQYAAMFTTLNNLRAGVPGLPPLTDPGNNTARVDTLFSERAFWMFATGHRLGDLRRLVRQYGRGESTVFPIGPYIKGGVYGSDVNMIIPIQEKNNPLSQGCLNRDA